jgi:hypothetical protein
LCPFGANDETESAVLMRQSRYAAVANVESPSELAEGDAAPILGVKLSAGYRDWRLISVAHEEGHLQDIRAILSNDIAVNAYREGNLPFPDGTVIAQPGRTKTSAWYNSLLLIRGRRSFSARASHLRNPAPRNWFLPWTTSIPHAKLLIVAGQRGM